MTHIIKEESDRCIVYMQLVRNFINDGNAQSLIEHPETSGLLLFLKEIVKTRRVTIKQFSEYGVTVTNHKQQELYFCFYCHTDNDIMKNIILYTHRFLAPKIKSFAIELSYSSYKIINL